jgi:hypothetical protein
MQPCLTALHCVRCNSSNSINSSIDCARIERLQNTHFDSRRNISFCTTGFRIKSDSSNSILQSFADHLTMKQARWLGVRYLLRLGGTDATGLPNHGEQTSFLCPRFCCELGHRPLGSVRIRMSSIGFLDTFDPFDSPHAALPENFLQLALLSFVSVLVCHLLLQKSAIA